MPYSGNGVHMKNLAAWALFALTFSLRLFPQAEVPTFKANVRNTFIWGEDAPGGAISSLIRDPLTGADTLKLKNNNVEVISQMGFEKLHPEDVAEFIAFSTTITNNTERDLTVEQGGVTVDGQLVSRLSQDSSNEGAKKKRSREATLVNILNLHCFNSGYLSAEKTPPLPQSSSAMIVGPQTSSTLSGIIRDPRHYPLLCSPGGCFPKGTIRYSVRVGGHEYIFAWNGRSVPNCGR